MRRTWLRRRENVHKRHLIPVAGHNLGLLMRQLTGFGTPKEAAARGRMLLLLVDGEHVLAMLHLAVADLGGEDGWSTFIRAVTGKPT